MEEEVSFNTEKTQYKTQTSVYGSYISWVLLIKAENKAKMLLFCSVVRFSLPVNINTSVSTQFFMLFSKIALFSYKITFKERRIQSSKPWSHIHSVLGFKLTKCKYVGGELHIFLMYTMNNI